MYSSHRHVERVDLYVGGTVDGSLCFVACDVEQRVVLKLVRPLHLQRRLTERTGPAVQELRETGANTTQQCEDVLYYCSYR